MRFSTLVVLVAVYFIFFTDEGNRMAMSFLKDITAETDISKYTCDMMAARFEGETVQNMLGGTFRILEIDNIKQVKKTDAEIICRGRAYLSNGREQTMQLSGRNRNGKIYFEAKSL